MATNYRPNAIARPTMNRSYLIAARAKGHGTTYKSAPRSDNTPRPRWRAAGSM